jgi:hypothetical protein
MEKMAMAKKTVSSVSICKIFLELTLRSQDPSDNILKDSLMEYARRGLTKEERINRLQADHNLCIR